MPILARAILAALFIATSSIPVFAWEVLEGWRDPIGGRTYTAASTTNDEGMSITIFRDVDERVLAVYSIPVSSFDRLPIEGRVLSIRPGNLDVVDITAAFEDVGPVRRARSDGRNIRNSMWHGQDPSPTFGTLRNILDSDILYARFHTDSGGMIETTWSLDGAPQVISTAIGINATAAPEAVEWSTLQAELLISSTRRCDQNVSCMRQMTDCMGLLRSMADVETFNRCVERVAP
jgi:hypothetical protein